jgi:N-methylhydantoinase A/oxoprolinase/acetone carboxylase beta subunit
MEKLAASLDVSIDRCAWGIHDLVNESMSKAAAMHATDLGVDPRSLPMVAFGGAGPVHAYGIARKLGIKRIICPTGAGVTSAIEAPHRAGRRGSVRQFPMGVDNWDFDQMRRLLGDLAAQGSEVVSAAECCERGNHQPLHRRHALRRARGMRSRLRCPTAVCRGMNFFISSWTTSPSSTVSCLAEP